MKIDSNSSTGSAFTDKAAPNTRQPTAAADVLVDWSSRLDRVALSEPTVAATFVESVAKGLAHAVGASTAQAVFNDLIAHEAYELFADVFTAYHSHSPSRESPSSLTLCLPADWVCTAEGERNAAFGRIKVQRLEVVRPQMAPGKDADSTARAHRLTPVSAAACDCAVTLLQAGRTTELVVHGVLASPGAVAEAMAANPLVSVELGDTSPLVLELTAPEQQTYKTLLSNLAVCRTLKHLTLGHAELANLHGVIGAFLKDGGPKLTSVKLIGREFEVELPDQDDEDEAPDGADANGGKRDCMVEILPFVRVMARIHTLTTLTVHAFANNVESLSAAFLEPLKGHPSLTQLDVIRRGELRVDMRNKMALPRVIAFAETCPSLTHFTWAAGTLVLSAGELMQMEMAMSPEALMQHVVKKMAIALGVEPSELLSHAKPRAEAVSKFRLQSLTLIGMPFTPAAIEVFFKSLCLKNSPLEHVDFSGGYMDVLAVLGLMKQLPSMEMLKTFLIPDKAAAFYFRSGKYIHGLDGNAPGAGLKHPQDRETFRLKLARYVDNAAKKMAEAAFAELTVKTPQALIEPFRTHALTRFAWPEMQRDVAHSMFVLSGSAQRFDDVSGFVLKELFESGALTSIVHLSEVSKAMDHRMLHAPSASSTARKLPTAVKQILRQNKLDSAGETPRDE